MRKERPPWLYLAEADDLDASKTDTLPSLDDSTAAEELAPDEPTADDTAQHEAPDPVTLPPMDTSVDVAAVFTDLPAEAVVDGSVEAAAADAGDPPPETRAAAPIMELDVAELGLSEATSQTGESVWRTVERDED